MPENITPKGIFPPLLNHTPAAPLATAPVDRLWSSPDGNEHAFYRDLFRRRDGRPFIKAYFPSPAEETDGISRGTLHLYIGPGQGVSRRAKAGISVYRPMLRHPTEFPQRIEVEFSATPAAAYPAAEGTPEDYLRSAIDWAIETCPVVALCVDQEPGTVAGEPHRVIGNLQATFRTPLAFAGIWEDFLRRRIRARRRLVIVHGAEMGRCQ